LVPTKLKMSSRLMGGNGYNILMLEAVWGELKGFTKIENNQPTNS
jgi:hypothetical protein